MDPREVYPNAPVVLVAFEVRHPSAAPFSSGSLVRVKKMLGEVAPLLRETTLVNLNVQVPAAQPEVITETAPKFFSRDGATAVTFRREAVVVETTKYERYERLRSVAKLALEARQNVEPVDGVDRVGLRYIDEIRAPEAGVDSTSWQPWIDSSLLGPVTIGQSLDLTPSQFQGVASFAGPPGRSLVLRYGPREGYAVDPAGELKRTTSPPGPYFLLDIDSFWVAADETPALEPDRVLELCDNLHSPVRTLFERVITDRLREEILRNDD